MSFFFWENSLIAKIYFYYILIYMYIYINSITCNNITITWNKIKYIFLKKEFYLSLLKFIKFMLKH